MPDRERKDLTWKERLLFALGGLFTAAYGYGQLLRGKLIFRNAHRLDVSAQFVMFLGGLFLLIAIFPWGRLTFLWEAKDKKRHRKGARF